MVLQIHESGAENDRMHNDIGFEWMQIDAKYSIQKTTTNTLIRDKMIVNNKNNIIVELNISLDKKENNLNKWIWGGYRPLTPMGCRRSVLHDSNKPQTSNS